jgi:hypothetical protein
MSKFIRWAITAGALLALLVPLAATAGGDYPVQDRDRRVLYDRQRIRPSERVFPVARSTRQSCALTFPTLVPAT